MTNKLKTKIKLWQVHFAALFLMELRGFLGVSKPGPVHKQGYIATYQTLKMWIFLCRHNFTFENFAQENGQKYLNMLLKWVEMDNKFRKQKKS